MYDRDDEHTIFPIDVIERVREVAEEGPPRPILRSWTEPRSSGDPLEAIVHGAMETAPHLRVLLVVPASSSLVVNQGARGEANSAHRRSS